MAATVLLGGLLLIYNAVSGDESGGGTVVQSRPTSIATALVALNQPAPARTAVAGSATPSGSATPTGSVTPTVTGTVVSGTPQPNRADCTLIRGSDYQSDAERAFFNANCLNPPTVTPSAGSPTSGGSNSGTSGGQTVVPGPPPPPPTPTVPPRNPQQVAFESLVGTTIAEAEAVIARLSAPEAVDSGWRSEVTAHIAEVQRLVGAASITPPPSCLVVPYQTVRSAGIELSIGTGLANSGVDANDLNLMRLASQRIATGKSSLVSALIAITNADC